MRYTFLSVNFSFELVLLNMMREVFQSHVLLSFACPKESNKENGSTNTAPFPAAIRFATTHAPSEPLYSCTSTRDNRLNNSI
jgi:hypothetical protein